MGHTTSLKDKARNWWDEICLDVVKRNNFVFKYESELSKSYWLKPSEIEFIYLKEHPTEAEVSKEEETVEQAASKQWGNVGFDKSDFIQYTYMKGAEFAANWQKEKDRVLISELLDALKVTRTLNLHLYEPDTVGNRAYKKFQEAITKAEKHLNNQ